MKLITGREYLSKIKRNASWSPWHARASGAGNQVGANLRGIPFGRFAVDVFFQQIQTVITLHD